jgi:hypothetical protein
MARIAAGNLFHTTGAWFAKALSQRVFTRTDGGTRSWWADGAIEDRNMQPPGLAMLGRLNSLDK